MESEQKQVSSLPPLIQALLEPEAYPHHPKQVELVQTQMSFVLLTGDYVYKIKKPVDLGYLDYTTLEKRRLFCHQEVKLNRRLCPETYLAVVPVVCKEGKILIEAKGEALEYGVKMRQLPRERMMNILLTQNMVTKEMVTAVAEKLANFHRKAATNTKISTFGGLDIIARNNEENFSQTEKYIGITLSTQKYQHLRAYTRSFIEQNKVLFLKRVREGRIKDCHGDLHAAHICFADGVCIYDCIEFNDRFRYCDVASEIAFLAMDLDHYSKTDLSQEFVNAYVKLSGDEELMELLNFYKCYRAYVRGKVESFKLDDPYISQEEKERILNTAKGYFDLAYSYIKPKLRLFITAGLVGTGKTTLAQTLKERLGLEIISSDITRKKLANIPLTEHRFEEFQHGIYSEDFSKKVYAQMLAEAKLLLNKGKSVMIDASFKKVSDRSKARKLAEEAGADFIVIECLLDEATIKKRLEQRLKEGSISNGRWEIYHSQKEDFDPITEITSNQHLIINTSREPSELAEEILEKLD